jgi:hypothetical protein
MFLMSNIGNYRRKSAKTAVELTNQGGDNFFSYEK